MRNENHKRAPVCAEFVEKMREQFGEVRVIHVNEGDFRLGHSPTYALASIFDVDAAIQAAGRKRASKT